jgi:hypothetical protein
VHIAHTILGIKRFQRFGIIGVRLCWHWRADEILNLSVPSSIVGWIRSIQIASGGYSCDLWDTLLLMLRQNRHAVAHLALRIVREPSLRVTQQELLRSVRAPCALCVRCGIPASR